MHRGRRKAGRGAYVPSACPVEQLASGSNGERRRDHRKPPGQLLASSAPVRIRDLPNSCSRTRAQRRLTRSLKLQSKAAPLIATERLPNNRLKVRPMSDRSMSTGRLWAVLLGVDALVTASTILVWRQSGTPWTETLVSSGVVALAVLIAGPWAIRRTRARVEEAMRQQP